MNPGPLQILLILVVVLLFFGRGKISELMGDFGKGIRSFKRGLNDDKQEAQKVEDETKRADEAVDVTPREAASQRDDQRRDS